MAGESADDLARRQRDRAEWLMQSAEHYERGAEGERRTAEVLDALSGYGYTALHDLKWPGRQRANIDHVLVGPSGVYLIDSKNWSGRVVLGQGTLKQNGYRRDRELASCGEAALALVQELNADVVPMLCLVRDEEVAGVVQNVHVCTTANLHRLILSRRAILSPGEISRILAVLRTGPGARRSSPAPNTSPKSGLTAREHLGLLASRRRGAGGARRSKQRMELVKLVILLMVLVGACSFVNSTADRGLLAGLGDVGTDDSSRAGVPFGKASSLTDDGGASVLVRVGKPVGAQPKDGGAHVTPGTRLVSVPVVIRNTGRQKWQPEAVVRWSAEGSLGNGVSPWLIPRDVTTGRRLPAVRAVWPGKPHRGVLVFEVPRGQRLESVSLQTSHFGRPDATWASTSK